MLRNLDAPGWQRRAVFGGDVDNPRRGSRGWTVRQLLAAAVITAAVTWLALVSYGCPLSCEQQATVIAAMPAGAAKDAELVKFNREHPNGCAPAPTPSPTATPTPAPTPTPTPTPVPLCVIDFDRFELVEGGAASAELDAVVKTAEINAHPEGCDSGRCVLNMPRPQWHHEVCRELQVAGFCCGASDEDEITVGYTATEGARVTNFHVWVGDPAGPGTVLWPPQARRDSWTLVPKGQPAPTPTPDACGNPQPPPLVAFGAQSWTGRPGTECYNGSPLVRDTAYCAAVGYTDGRQTCAVRPDCNPAAGPCRFVDKVACEALIVGGNPVWEYAGALEHPPDGSGRANPWRICVTYQEPGELRLCNADRSHCQVVVRQP